MASIYTYGCYCKIFNVVILKYLTMHYGNLHGYFVVLKLARLFDHLLNNYDISETSNRKTVKFSQMSLLNKLIIL